MEEEKKGNYTMSPAALAARQANLAKMQTAKQLNAERRREIKRKASEMTKAIEQTAKTAIATGNLPTSNKQLLQHNIEVAALYDIDTDNVVEVSQRTAAYFELCVKNGAEPSIAAYALALGTDRKTLTAWIKGTEAKSPEVRKAISKAFGIINAQLEARMQSGQINGQAGKFLMTNNLGYQVENKVEEVVVDNTEEISENEILMRYADLAEEC